jgi:hypothetical protein
LERIIVGLAFKCDAISDQHAGETGVERGRAAVAGDPGVEPRFFLPVGEDGFAALSAAFLELFAVDHHAIATCCAAMWSA